MNINNVSEHAWAAYQDGQSDAVTFATDFQRITVTLDECREELSTANKIWARTSNDIAGAYWLGYMDSLTAIIHKVEKEGGA